MRDVPTLGGMGPVPALPADFARQLAEILKPGDEQAAAQVIEAAIRLDDARLAHFLDLLAERVRSSGRPISGSELREFLRVSAKSGRAAP